MDYKLINQMEQCTEECGLMTSKMEKVKYSLQMEALIKVILKME